MGEASSTQTIRVAPPPSAEELERLLGCRLGDFEGMQAWRQRQLIRMAGLLGQYTTEEILTLCVQTPCVPFDAEAASRHLQTVALTIETVELEKVKRGCNWESLSSVERLHALEKAAGQWVANKTMSLDSATLSKIKRSTDWANVTAVERLLILRSHGCHKPPSKRCDNCDNGKDFALDDRFEKLQTGQRDMKLTCKVCRREQHVGL
jgi:hypothetical protein